MRGSLDHCKSSLIDFIHLCKFSISHSTHVSPTWITRSPTHHAQLLFANKPPCGGDCLRNIFCFTRINKQANEQTNLKYDLKRLEMFNFTLGLVSNTPTFFVNGVDLGVGTYLPTYADWIAFLDPIINASRRKHWTWHSQQKQLLCSFCWFSYQMTDTSVEFSICIYWIHKQKAKK